MTNPDHIERALRAAPATDWAGDLAEVLARADAEGLLDVAFAHLDSPIGTLLVASTATGLVRVGFEQEGDDAVLAELAERVSPRIVESSPRLDRVRRELDEYFSGRREHFGIPLDWRLSSGFRRVVLEHLVAEVRYGQTVSYGELAAMAGNPKASRAVGSAMATNPLPIVVPCHRVLRTGGHLGGYGGGIETKIRLLALESGQQVLA